MNKKLPSIYKGSDCTHIKNNKSVFSTSYYDRNITEDNRSSNDVMVNNLIFNTPVVIKTNDEVIHAKIVSKVDDHILTSTNRIINLKDIRAIES